MTPVKAVISSAWAGSEVSGCGSGEVVVEDDELDEKEAIEACEARVLPLADLVA